MDAPNPFDSAPAHMTGLFVSVGQAVIAAALLERTLVFDALGRLLERHGLGDRLRAELARLEKQPAGPTLQRLRDVGMPEDLAERVDDAIDERNWMVHRLLADPEAIAAFASGDGIDELVERIHTITVTSSQLAAELAETAFAPWEQLLGISKDDLIRTLTTVELPEGQEHDDLRTLRNAATSLSRLLVQGA
jgi:hypothetical protein